MARSLPLLVHGACPHDCPDTCAWDVKVEAGRAVAIEPDRDHPFTAGGLCAKVNRFLEDRVYHPDRLLYPLKRVGPKGSGDFERIGWDQALEEIAARLRDVIERHGSEAIAPYSYMGNQGYLNGMGMHERFFARLGASVMERTICGDNGQIGMAATVGQDVGFDPEHLEHSRFIIIWGTNTVVTNLHLWPFIERARAAGATVVVIDPVRTRTAQAADRHVRPLPGTDAALALGMMNAIVSEGLTDDDYISRYTTGFDQLRARLDEYPLEKVAAITGIEVAEIEWLARSYAGTRPAAIRTLVGMDHRANAAMTFRTIACLPALTGAWRDVGGGISGMMGRHVRRALDMTGLTMPSLVEPSRRVLSMLEIGRALTDAGMSPPVAALFVFSSNPAAIAPNQNLVLQGLAREDLFTVVHEQFMTDTARFADMVLPATTQPEQLELVYSWGHTYITLNQPAIAPQGESVSNTELFRRLSSALGMDHPELHESDESMIRNLLSTGHRFLDGITFESLLETGWARLRIPEDEHAPFARGGFPTPTGKCEFYSEAMLEQGLDPLPAFEPGPETPAGDPELRARFPLAMISAKALHFLNSSYGAVERHNRAEKELFADLNDADAAARGVSDGEMVRVFNDRGEVLARARVGDRVGPGVVAIPFGWWASKTGGRSSNALTNDAVATFGRGSAFFDTLVEVARA